MTLQPMSLIITGGGKNLSSDEQAGGTSSHSQFFTLSHCLKLTQNTASSKTEGNETCDITSYEQVRICGQTVENNINLAAVRTSFLTCSFELSDTCFKLLTANANESRCGRKVDWILNSRMWVCFLL